MNFQMLFNVQEAAVILDDASMGCKSKKPSAKLPPTERNINLLLQFHGRISYCNFMGEVVKAPVQTTIVLNLLEVEVHVEAKSVYPQRFHLPVCT